jgi:phenol 2-monooxygenase
MNVSMMDSYNLAWKLAHTIHGLSPKHQSNSNNESEQKTPTSVLNTFEYERLTVARQLIEFDSKFSSMFSGQIGAEESVEGLTHEEFLKVFSDGSGFTSGCGVEYAPSILIDQSSNPETIARVGAINSVNGDAYLSGVLRSGRRLLDTVVRRYADSNPRHLHDDFLSTGRYRILVFTTHDLVDRQKEAADKSDPSISAQALETICRDIIPAHPKDTIELVALHPFHARDFEWDQMPSCLKEFAEMSFHGPIGTMPLYEVYGVDQSRGAVVAVRPDGYVGAVKALIDAKSLGDYFDNCLVRIDA